MRRGLPLWFVIVAALAPETAFAQAAGAKETPSPAATGGTLYGDPGPLVATEFAVRPATIRPGASVTFTYRIDGGGRRARARIDLVREGQRRPAARLPLGRPRTGRRHTRRWTGQLPQGRYVARLHAVARGGKRLVRSARASGRSALRVTAPVRVRSGVFPVQGPYSFGADDARFGAPRSGRSHQGQDIVAAEGTPVVAPRPGTVSWRAYQARGAGHYLVVRGDDGRDYVFMHLQDGSLLVDRGVRVAAGQRLAAVGNTGASSGAHLHFEIWVGGWYEEGGAPIDPRPELENWAAGR